MSAPTSVPLLFLDLDGTVRHGKDELGRFVNGPEDVVVFSEAISLMLRWRQAGGRIAGISNQGGIALGLVSPDDVNAALMKTNKATGRLFDDLVYCRHHPDAVDPSLARCWCRKPLPGAPLWVLASLAMRYPGENYPPDRALFVGDRPEDQQCAATLGVDFMWAKDWRAQANGS